MTNSIVVKTNLVSNHKEYVPISITDALNRSDNSNSPEHEPIRTILWPFLYHFNEMRIQFPEYLWQDFILQCYDECFVPLHRTCPASRQAVCHRLARLLWADRTKPLTKEQYLWIQLYAPYLTLVPSKIIHMKAYTPQERSIINEAFYTQVLVKPPPPSSSKPVVSLPPLEKFSKPQKPTPSILSKRKREEEVVVEVKDQEQEEEEETTSVAEFGRQFAIADAHVIKSTRLRDMAIAYHNELLRKCEQYKTITIPRYNKQIELYKKQRTELVEKINKSNNNILVNKK